MSGHYIKKCAKCDATIEQCKCPCGQKEVQHGICNRCQYEMELVAKCEREQQAKKKEQP